MGLFNAKKKKETTTTTVTITKTTAGQSSAPRKQDPVGTGGTTGNPSNDGPGQNGFNGGPGPGGTGDSTQGKDTKSGETAGQSGTVGSGGGGVDQGSPSGQGGQGNGSNPQQVANTAKQPNLVAAIAAEVTAQTGPAKYEPEVHATPTGPASQVVQEQPKAPAVVESYFPPDNALSKTINLYGISSVLFNIVKAIMSSYNWEDPVFLQNMSLHISSLKKETGVLTNHAMLKDWVHPLHYRKTGSVLGAGRRMANLLKDFLPIMDSLQESNGKGFGGHEQTRTREVAKDLLNTFLLLCNCVEMVVATDFSTEVNELAKTMRDVVDTASGNLPYVFDDVARICTTSAIRLCRLSLWKGAQSQNVQWVRQLTDNCFTVTRATKVMRVVGGALYDNQQDQQAFQNLTTLTRGLVAHIKNIQTTTSFEPPASMAMISFTPALIQEHLMIYDLSINEVQDAFNRYLSVVTTNVTMSQSINEVVSQLMVIKNSLVTPDTIALVNAIGVITASVERLCASVYFALLSLGSSNEVLKEQIMETMQCSIHCCIQLHIIAASKAMFHPIVNPEITMLSSVRFLLLSISIVIEAVSYMKSTELIGEESNDNLTDLQTDEIKAAIVYILHYGRPLFKGEGEEPSEEPVIETPKPAVHNNIFYPQGIPEDLRKKDGEDDDGFPIMDGIDDPEPDQPPQQQPVADESFEEASSSSEVAPQPQPTQPQPVKTTPVAPTPEVKKPDPPTPTPAPAAVAEPPKDSLNWADPLSLPKDVVLKLNPNDYSESNLPPGFDPQPVKPEPKKGMTEDEYKAFMVQKYEFEQWENKLILWKIKLKRRIDEVK